MIDPTPLFDQLTTAFNQRDWNGALRVAAKLIPLAPKDAGVYYVAGLCNLETQQMTQAIACLRKAEQLAPQRVHYIVQLARAFNMVNRNRDAKEAADRASALSPTDPSTLDTLGVVYSQIGSYLSAVDAFQKVVERVPDHAPYRYNLATSLVTAGHLDAAEVQINACLELDPRYWRAHMTLAHLRRQTLDDNHVDQLNKLLESADREQGNPAELICLNMALAKEYEDLADYPKALGHLVTGKSVGGQERGYVIGRDERIFRAITDSFDEPIRGDSAGYESAEPIFVIGMPRTGTTLVDRIISSHPEVESAGELLNFGISVKQISGTTSSSIIDLDTIIGARQADWRKLGETYLLSTRPGTGARPHFVDKLPHNFLYAGFIARALPNAKIVCLRRNPMDTCLSNFRQLFAPKSPYFDYSFDLLDTGRYFVLFDRLMAHWEKVFPGRILQIQYEQLVDNQENISRRIIEFCGLPWTDACLRFEENPSPVATASAVQVRAPMYRSAMQRWKKYGEQLQPLQDLLVSAGIQIEP